MLKIILIITTFFAQGCNSTPRQNAIDKDAVKVSATNAQDNVIVGAERFEKYLPLLEGKKVAAMVNQTSVVGEQHLVDVLIAKGINVVKVFAPEHGFRGTADAGELINDSKDSKTGLPIVSLYGISKKPNAAQLADVDIILFDIQDVGARFYTYISHMHYVMEGAAEQGKKVIVLDRPNPNGNYVDGPVLDLAYQSFVGTHEVPVVHGMTVGEFAKMINGQGWLKGGIKCELEVITCENYDHNTYYELPIKPSPNLPNQRSIMLYPSLCFIEGTTASAGRGTTRQFQIFGHPDFSTGMIDFTPVPMPGAKYPKHENKVCTGFSYESYTPEDIFNWRKISLDAVIDGYGLLGNDASAYFLKNNFIDKLAGSDQLRKQLIAGLSEDEIRASWEPQLNEYKQMRKQYLLYKDFD